MPESLFSLYRSDDIGVGGSEELSNHAEEHGTPEKRVRLLEWSEQQIVCACQVAAQTPDALSQRGAQTFAMLKIVLGTRRCSWLEVARWYAPLDDRRACPSSDPGPPAKRRDCTLKPAPMLTP